MARDLGSPGQKKVKVNICESEREGGCCWSVALVIMALGSPTPKKVKVNICECGCCWSVALVMMALGSPRPKKVKGNICTINMRLTLLSSELWTQK